MRALYGLVAVAVATALVWGHEARANQLRVEPVLIDLTAPGAAATVSLRNDSDTEVTVQARILGWRQRNGQENLEPTTEVVASPPQVRIAPKSTYVVRVVRVSRAPVQGEESYRLLIDQLPSLRQQQARAVSLLIRQSIPVFFRNREVNRPNVTWSYLRSGDAITLRATNAGDERLRLASVVLRDGSGRSFPIGNGLLGYVLGRSTMSWQVPRVPRGFGEGGSLSVSAQTDKQPVNAVARLAARP